MFSGKSTTLFQQMERLLLAKKSVLLIRPLKDNRGYFSHGNSIDIERFEQENRYKFETKYYKEINQSIVDSIINKKIFDAIFIDEFFMIPGSSLFCKQTNIDVYYCGLLASSECELFEEVIKILPYCDKITKLNGVCEMCGDDNGSYSFADFKKQEKIVVGDTKYKCLCQKCYNKAELEKKGVLKNETSSTFLQSNEKMG